MALPEYVGPVLAAGGPVALVAVVLRFGPDAVLRLLAGTVAVLGDEKRGERCLEVLRILRGRDPSTPPAPSDPVREQLPETGHRGPRGLALLSYVRAASRHREHKPLGAKRLDRA